MPLDDYVLSYNPVRRTPFRQAEWLAAINEKDDGGKCYAFTLTYILALAKGGTGEALIETLGVAAAKDDQTVIKEMMGTALRDDARPGSDAWAGTDMFGLQTDSHQRDRVLTGFGLQPTSPVLFKHKKKKFDDLGDYVATTGTSYSMLCTPNHALAATSLPSGRKMWTFFDPNLGEAAFSTREDLQACIANFFADKTVKDSYRRKEVKAKHGDALLRQQMEVKKMTVDVLRWTEI
jgi:hypothetical protein